MVNRDHGLEWDFDGKIIVMIAQYIYIYQDKIVTRANC
jgi:hypothetical protein